MSSEWPSYLALYRSGELQHRAETLRNMYSDCRLCPHQCGVDRTTGQKGFCKAPADCVYSTACAHGGEEPVLSGYNGSGTIFFTYCNSRCSFCQNYDISQLAHGKTITVQGLADLYLALQSRGCHNVNFVTPAHYIPHIVEALVLAVREGFSIPLVYNSNGYDSVDILRLLDGVVDIYLPDMKYSHEPTGRRLSSLPEYPEISRAAVAEMFRQVGLLKTNERGIALRGLIIRHLVLPNDLAGTAGVLRSIADIDTRIALSLMGQYHPAYKACDMEGLNRRLTKNEYETAARLMIERQPEIARLRPTNHDWNDDLRSHRAAPAAQ